MISYLYYMKMYIVPTIASLRNYVTFDPMF